MKTSVFIAGWVPLSLAIFFSVLGTISMKLSHGLSVPKHVIYLSIFYTISFAALTFAIKHLELSMVYAVWSGVGTLLVAMVGKLFFNESFPLRKIIFLSSIIIGVIGIHFSHVFP